MPPDPPSSPGPDFLAMVIDVFRQALEPEYIVLGGGNAKLIKELPPDVRRGANENAFVGGFRLWQADAPSKAVVEVTNSAVEKGPTPE